MNKEKIIKRKDGSRVRIDVSFYISGSKPKYDYSVWTCKPRKRTWTHIVDRDHYKYRDMSMEERVKFVKKECFKYVTIEEVYSTMTLLWLDMKPVPIVSETNGCRGHEQEI